jgi:cyclin-dependent kinase
MERYLLLECLGEGSNGKVHKAQDKESGVYVALKFINVDDLTEGIPAYALREVNILSALHHPHIIGLREVIINGSQVILVLEYMKTNLYSFMQRHPDRLPAVQIKKWFYELLKGVNYMHSQLILHRDLKPENLLLNKTNTLKIADFGLSTQLVSKDQKSSNHHVISLWYKAPELLVPHVNYLYSFEVDMWSCGCIFAEMWTGIPLFCGLNQADQLAVIMEKRGTSWLQERYPEKKWPILLPTPTVEWALVQDENALDLLEQCLQMNPNARISAALALRHPYFAELHGERKP